MLYKFIIDGAECWLTLETGEAILARLEWERDTDHPEDWETCFS